MTATVTRAPRMRAHHYLSILPQTVVFDVANEPVSWNATVLHQPGVLAWVADVAEGEGVLPHITLVGLNGTMRWDRPRGLSWRDYPVLSDMRLRLARPDEERAVAGVWLHGPGAPSHAYQVEIPKALRAAGVIVVSLLSASGPPDERDAAREMSRVHALVRAAAPETSPQVILLRTGEEPETMTFGEFGDRLEPWAAYDRFDFSYGVNAGVILGRALRECIATPVMADHVPASLVTGDDLTLESARRLAAQGHLGSMIDPLTLQVLFRLRRAGGMLPAQWNGRFDLDRGEHGEVLSGGPSDEAGRQVWHGTGKHPARPLDEDVDRSRQAGWTLRGPIRFGLVGVDGRNVYLTDSGHRFLGMMHPDNEDADLPLRWHGPTDAAMRASMDDWILRNFRKMQNKVDEALNGGEG